LKDIARDLLEWAKIELIKKREAGDGEDFLPTAA
jgi:hypothetical protein